MYEELIITQCSPTLAGIKTGSIFNYCFNDKNVFTEDVRRLNHQIKPKGLRVIPLKFTNTGALLYIYRPLMLIKDLSVPETMALLKSFGYTLSNCDMCVAQLCRHFNNGEKFPHEVGLFLGYPAEDVRGFIDNHAKWAKCAGYWKVYGDENKAKKTFQRYKKCTELYYRKWSDGKSIENLIVAVCSAV